MDLLDQFEVGLDERRREPHRWFVHQQHTGVGHQGATHGDHLLFATRQGAGLLIQPLLHPREHLVDALEVGFNAVVVTEIRPEFEVLLDGQTLEQAPVLGNHRDATLDPIRRRLVVDDFAIEHNLTGRRRDHAQQGLESRGLPGGVTAEEADQLTRIDRQVDVFQDVDCAVVGVDPAKFEQRGRGLDGFAHDASSAGRPRYASITAGSDETSS